MSSFEFVVIGTPISAQASGRARRLWQSHVAEAAKTVHSTKAWNTRNAVRLRVAYFWIDAPSADLDNIVKPIQDALKDIAYDDDIQVVDLVASMRRKGGSADVVMTPALSDGFAGNSDFVYVRVELASDMQALK